MRTTTHRLNIPKSRKPLTPAHIALIKLLAEIAVKELLESESLHDEPSTVKGVGDYAIG